MVLGWGERCLGESERGDEALITNKFEADFNLWPQPHLAQSIMAEFTSLLRESITLVTVKPANLSSRTRIGADESCPSRLLPLFKLLSTNPDPFPTLQLYVPLDVAHTTVEELAHLERIQFKDVRRPSPPKKRCDRAEM